MEGNPITRRRALWIMGGGLAGGAITLGFVSNKFRAPSAGESGLGLVPGDTGAAKSNRRRLVDALTNSSTSFDLSGGDYFIDNAGSYPVIRNFSGRLKMNGGSRLVFTDNTTRGLQFEGGFGAELQGLSVTFQELPQKRIVPEECILFVDATDPVIRDIEVNGSVAAGLLFDRCNRPVVENAKIENTMADGLHFANCQDGEATNIRTENTGDDGLAFVNYSESPANTGGSARNVVVERSGTRGITVIGQSGVSVENFEVRETYNAGIKVAYEASFDTRVPREVTFRNGKVTDAGRGAAGTGGSSTNRHGIEIHEAGYGILCEDIDVHDSLEHGVSVISENGGATLARVRAYRSGLAGFNLWKPGDVTLSDALVQGSEGIGYNVVQGKSVRGRGVLRAEQCSRNDSLRRAFSFEENQVLDLNTLQVLDSQNPPTGYVVGFYGDQEGFVSSIEHDIDHGDVDIRNRSDVTVGETVAL